MKLFAGGVALAATLFAAVPAARADDAMDEAVKKYLESEDGKKALDKSLVDMGFAKAAFGSLKITGLIDVWFVSQRDGETSAGARTGAETFRLRRAEVAFAGSIVKDLVEYSLQIDPARPLGNNEAVAPTRNILADMKIMYKGVFGAPKDVILSVGQFKIPFSREGAPTQSSAKLDFINRADGVAALADARRPGAMIQGSPMNGAVEWFANVHNTSGQNGQDTSRDQKNWCGRLVINPLKFGSAEASKARIEKTGDLSFGASYLKGYATTGRQDFKNYAVDAEWRKSKVATDKDGVFLRTEWLRSDMDNPAVVADIRSHYYAGGYRVNDNWEGVVRHDVFKSQAGTTDRVTDTFGINYFIKGHNAKIDLDYIRIRQQTAADGRTLVAQIVLQFQVAF